VDLRHVPFDPSRNLQAELTGIWLGQCLADPRIGDNAFHVGPHGQPRGKLAINPHANHIDDVKRSVANASAV
jgi:hypothetical protein